MNPQLKKTLDKLQRETGRRRWSGSRFSTAPLVLTLGLIMADVMLTTLVPVMWETLLPGGLDQADTLLGLPGLVWRGAILCHRRQSAVRIAIAVVAVASLLACSRGRLLRAAVWLASVAVLLLNATILVVTLQAGLRATAASAGLDLG